MNIRFVGCGLLLIGLMAAPAWGAPAAPAGGTVATNIKAERMEYDADKQTVVFLSNVYVKRPDFELWAEKMTVYLKKKQDGAPEEKNSLGMEAGEIDRLIAEKNVRMKREDKEATSQKATYYADAGKIVLEGSPVLRDKDSVFKGAIITHYMRDNRSEASGVVDITFSAPDKGGKGGLPSFGPKGKK